GVQAAVLQTQRILALAQPATLPQAGGGETDKGKAGGDGEKRQDRGAILLPNGKRHEGRCRKHRRCPVDDFVGIRHRCPSTSYRQSVYGEMPNNPLAVSGAVAAG